ncbi:MAG: ABC transporter ATP-binding protein [Chloroflexi bacterium]|nr:ABC transporter ATP-binding protein [Chloroflexota bacterium]
MLEVDKLNVFFGGLRAVSDVSFGVKRGQIKAIIGPNGAGKTTVFNAITGVYRPSAGTVKFKGADVTGFKTTAIVERGLARTFQIVRLFQELTVLENVMVGLHRRGRAGLFDSMLHLPRVRAEERSFRESSWQKLAFVGLTGMANELAGALPFGQQRLLEIARCLASGPDLLLVDEPAAGLNDAETLRLATLLRRIRDAGITILLVEHNMELVMSVSDEIVVLNYGEKIAEGPPIQIQSNPDVIQAYLG